ncbi:hypothetical protein THOM_2225 [Trachipleistophora hominis]|uniref:Uncharacterized protein n=1 Tax=Trachipleistophora hominis TaxID=72359 RepID=L7JTP2_TRAHO|nr:hypothetical protein THOM_2225 [Trachipleistophora hominis]
MILTMLLCIVVFLIFLIFVGFAAGYIYSVHKNKEEMNRLMDSQQAKKMGLDSALQDYLVKKDEEVNNSFYGKPINNLYEKAGVIDKDTNKGAGGKGHGTDQQVKGSGKNEGNDKGAANKPDDGGKGPDDANGAGNANKPEPTAPGQNPPQK